MLSQAQSYLSVCIGIKVTTGYNFQGHVCDEFIFILFFFTVLPLYVHIKTEKKTLSADTVYDIHCTTFGSRPAALVTWWLGATQLLDHSSQVLYNVAEPFPKKERFFFGKVRVID